MGSRKRSRPNPKLDDKQKVEAPPSGPSKADGNSQNGTTPSTSTAQVPGSGVDDTNSSINQTASSRGWYNSGTWPRIQKSTPSTQVARETILAAKSSTATLSADFSRFEPKSTDVTPRSPPSASRQLSIPTKSATTVAMTPPDMPLKESPKPDIPILESPKTAIAPPEPKVDVEAPRPTTASRWLGWWSSSPQATNLEEISQATLDNEGVCPQEPEAQPPVKQMASDIALASNGSWFNLWPTLKPINAVDAETTVLKDPQAELDNTSADVPCSSGLVGPPAGSSWAFWSKEPTQASGGRTESVESGELAVTGESSHNDPTPAHATSSGKATQDKPDQAGAKTLKDPRLEKVKEGKRGRALLPTDIAADSHITPGADSSTLATPSQSPTPSKSTTTNLLLPSLGSTYRLMDSPSIMQQIARLFMNNQQPSADHVYLVKEPSKLRKALAIGVHGMFPAPLLRTVIGQPTGTSIRFANHAAAAINRWAEIHGCDCDIEKVALEGEGKIGERVDNLWKLLLNWIDHVRNADFILIACHSQGVPVSLMLVARLIEFGVVTSAKIGVCAMAGVSLGPFVDYKSRFFSGSAAELFDFAVHDSEVSKRYEESLRTALKYGVRVTFVGSIDDQLISLESAVFSPVNHPYIYRAVFVDGRVHAPDFIAHLVGFALKLRNLGVSDHGLIRELSVPLAGSLYTGEGHSRLYDEEKIYDLAVSFALETSSVGNIPLRVQKYDIPTVTNPFQLPWSMRGLLEENVVKTELDRETTELLNQFDQWKPTTKVLKDVKYRLEAVKSKL